MRILFLSQRYKIEDHPGFHDAFIKLVNEGEIKFYKNIPFYGYAKQHGWENFYNNIIDEVRLNNINVVYFQFFHGPTILNPENFLVKFKKTFPNVKIITSVGDGFSDNWMRIDYPKSFKVVSQYADITFSTQMGKAADKMTKWGAKNIVLSPHSLCQVRFKALSVDLKTHKFEYDVVFIGSNNGRRLFNPISKHWWGSVNRQKLVKALYEKFSNKFGLYGKLWDLPCAKGAIPFNQQQEYMQKGRVFVGATPYSFSDYYMSDRPFFSIASGIPTVEIYVPHLEKIFRPDDHIYFAKDVDEVIIKVDELLKKSPEEIYTKASLAAKYVWENHTTYERVKGELGIIKNYIKTGEIDLPNCFLPEVYKLEEKKYAIRLQ